MQLEQQQALDSRATAPDPQEEAEKGWKRLKYKLVGNPKLGLQHLADAEQQDILDERLKARRGGPTVTHYRLGQTRYELTQLRSAIRTSLSTLQGLMDAAGNLADSDYIQYALTRVEPLLVHFDELCALTRDGGARC
ncbi:MAG: hypothetical protein WDW38_007278 [Sanguina aurantia]